MFLIYFNNFILQQRKRVKYKIRLAIRLNSINRNIHFKLNLRKVWRALLLKYLWEVTFSILFDISNKDWLGLCDIYRQNFIGIIEIHIKSGSIPIVFNTAMILSDYWLDFLYIFQRDIKHLVPCKSSAENSNLKVKIKTFLIQILMREKKTIPPE